MIISRVRVKNLCAVRDVSLPCEPLTVLVGRNGTGKSTFLRALELFYAPSPQLSASDFFAEDCTSDVAITVVFTHLSPAARDLFERYLQGDELTVTRVLSLTSGKIVAKYYGSTLRHEPFQHIRAISGARELTKAYNGLRENSLYTDLPEATKRDDAVEGLRSWEASHQSQCVRLRDDGQFFGFTEVAQGYLGRFTRLIRIPAVRDAGQDAEEGRGSPITQLLDLVVRRSLSRREDFISLKGEIELKYKAIIDPEKSASFASLAAALTTTLQTFVPTAGVSLSWGQAPPLELALPRAEVRVTEDGYLSPVERTGHGMQRAFIITLLQHLALTESPAPDTEHTEQAKAPEGSDIPGLVLLIEEPELYQHPNRQRHFAALLARLAAGSVPGFASSTQVLYCTHSPLFVGLDRFDNIRMVRKVSVEGSPIKASVVASVALDTVAQELWNNTDEQQPKYTADSLRPRLAAVMTPWVNEGFFADVAVLVEGEGDRAAILAVADYLGYDLEATGFSVIPCMGKPNLDRPLVIFRALGVPTYVLWDSDQEGEDPKPDQNRSLLRLLGRTEEDWPGFVGSDAACFRTDLERTLEAELGKEAWNKHLDDARSAVGLTKKQAKKNPVVIRTVVQTAKLAGQTSPTLEQIVNSLWELRSSTTNKDEAEATPATVQSATTARVDKPAVPVLDTPCA